MIRIFFNRVVLLAGLGFFVDVFDLFLFSVLRRPSLKSLGISPEKMAIVGEQLLATQMWGMLLGGFLWGIIGDKKGRLTVLLGSILTYSLATAANAWVVNETQYHWCRFFSGLGLAGELGAGISLVLEQLKTKERGIGAFFVASLGALGAVFAAILGSFISWKTAFIVGGSLGIILLFFRFGVTESEIYSQQKTKQSERGALKFILKNKRWKTYIGMIFAGVPIWFTAGLIVGFLPEICKENGINNIEVSPALIWFQSAYSLGDIGSGLISQYWQSRIKTLRFFLIGWSLVILSFFMALHWGVSSEWIYFLTFMMGLFSGYMAVFVTTVAEQFGTNIRNTVTSTVVNLMRGSVVILVPIHLYFMKHWEWNQAFSLMGISIMVLLLAIWGQRQMKESFHISLDYSEKGKP